MDQMELESKKRHSRLFGRIGIVLLVLFGLVLLILSAVTLHRVKELPDVTFNSNRGQLVENAGLLDRFPGYFRTIEEQKLHERRLRELANITEASSPWLWELYNACCLSQSAYLRPTQMEDITGVMRNITQMNGQNQYVLQETCQQVTDCGGRKCNCGCVLMNFLVSLVYTDAEANDHQVGLFYGGKVCKCINF